MQTVLRRGGRGRALAGAARWGRAGAARWARAGGRVLAGTARWARAGGRAGSKRGRAGWGVSNLRPDRGPRRRRWPRCGRR